MKGYGWHLGFITLLGLGVLITPSTDGHTQIRTGAAAIDGIGQYDQKSFTEPVFSFGKPGFDDSPNKLGLIYPNDSVVDEVNHRLFVVDTFHNRILVFNLNAQNKPASKFPAHVLGQPDFISANGAVSRAGLQRPGRAAYSPSRNLLFVVDSENHRVVVYDVASITNGENAAFVLGQSDFSSNQPGVTSSRFGNPLGVALDDTGGRLFVSMANGSRVLIFNIADGITNGESATLVLGQPDFTTSQTPSSPNERNFFYPQGMTYDSQHGRLFVADNVFNRVLVFYNQLLTANNPSASELLCQNSFTSDAGGAQAAQCSGPRDVDYLYIDSANNSLDQDTVFVADSFNNRVQVFRNSGPGELGQGKASDATLGQLAPPQSSWNVSQTRLQDPSGISLSATSATLYVADNTNHRMMVFDVETATTTEPAVDMYGQYDEQSYTSPNVKYDKNGAANSPSQFGLGDLAGSTVFDYTRHRLFIADPRNNRVLVFTLNEQNQLVTKVPAQVLGQIDFASKNSATSQSGMNAPTSLAYDSLRDRLFVSDTLNNRVLAFDTSSIVNGLPAQFVLGQQNFTSSANVVTQSGMFSPQGLALDEVNQRLFVASSNQNRVLVFDTSSLSTGMNASSVLGQANFTSSSLGQPSASSIATPTGLAFDSENKRLFVSDSGTNRVLIFDVSTISNGEDATRVLCQSSFTTASSSTTDSTCSQPAGLSYDSTSQVLYLADRSNNRVLAYDATQITNGEAATHVLGQGNFTSSESGSEATKLYLPEWVSYDGPGNKLAVSLYGKVFMFPTRYAFEYSGSSFAESLANNGVVATTLTTTLIGDSFASTVTGALTRGVHYTISGVPSGLSETITATTRTTATVSFVGAATAHESSNNTTITLTFLDAALTNGPASGMSGNTANLSIAFINAPTPTPPTTSSCFSGSLPRPSVKIKGKVATIQLPTGITPSAACTIRAKGVSKASKKPRVRSFGIGKRSTTLSKLPKGRWTFTYEVTTTALGTSQASTTKGATVK